MNDTTRKELREQVGGELVIAYTIGSDRKETDFTDTADRIIALVRAARDAEIREALLSDDAVDVAFRKYWEKDGVSDATEMRYMRAAVSAALNHIGLGEESKS